MNALTPPRRHEVAAGAIELVRLRLSDDSAFAFFDVRTPTAHLRHGRARRRPDGRVEVQGPKILGRQGNDFGLAWALAPEFRAQVEALLAASWPEAADDGG